MNRPERTGLLVSVRSAAEARAALAGGADLIDVKEPNRGPLGRADDAVIADVMRTVAGRKPVSAALGELPAAPHTTGPLPAGLSYWKWGLAGWNNSDCFPWLERLVWEATIQEGHPPHGFRAVLVAYADWQRAQSPPPEAVLQASRGGYRWGAFLLDTFNKDGSTLLDWLPLEHLTQLRTRCREIGLRIALAGSLAVNEIEVLKTLQPDWFAVRGAACVGGRAGTIDEGRVRELAGVLSK
ncbi:MAG: hypothetical protein JNM56_03580 [Planctomycetia bacterium]|nr:hypothetical protein [Planctomycetia bacterium]